MFSMVALLDLVPGIDTRRPGTCGTLNQGYTVLRRVQTAYKLEIENQFLEQNIYVCVRHILLLQSVLCMCTRYHEYVTSN